jgi:hypothetical protein
MADCHLELLVGRKVACSHSACPFWEPGGAVIEARCAFERLHFSLTPDVAVELLQLRDALLEAAGVGQRTVARRAFYRRLNEEAEFES